MLSNHLICLIRQKVFQVNMEGPLNTHLFIIQAINAQRDSQRVSNSQWTWENIFLKLVCRLSHVVPWVLRCNHEFWRAPPNFESVTSIHWGEQNTCEQRDLLFVIRKFGGCRREVQACRECFEGLNYWSWSNRGACECIQELRMHSHDERRILKSYHVLS